MPRPRKPTATLELTGAFKKNPQRAAARKGEPKPSGPLGAPPDYLSETERACWNELSELSPAGVLTNADRPLVELGSRLWAKIREDGIGGKYGVTVGEIAQYKDCLIRMGLTPVDRSKINLAPNEEQKNEFEEFAEGAEVRPN